MQPAHILCQVLSGQQQESTAVAVRRPTNAWFMLIGWPCLLVRGNPRGLCGVFRNSNTEVSLPASQPASQPGN
jgi:hypothetical protein